MFSRQVWKPALAKTARQNMGGELRRADRPPSADPMSGVELWDRLGSDAKTLLIWISSSALPCGMVFDALRRACAEWLTCRIAEGIS